MGYFDVAQICLNGHLITHSANTSPHFRQKYCSICGAKTIDKCPSCKAPIRGDYKVENVIVLGAIYEIPKYCHNCGKPYPWTEKTIEASKELINEMANLTADEKKLLLKSIEDLIKEIPRTQLAIFHFKKLVAKSGREFAIALREILINILSETMVKQIFGG